MEKETHSTTYYDEHPAYGGGLIDQQTPEGIIDKSSQSYKDAEKQVKKLKGFYGHAFFYVLINGFLIAMNLITDPFEIWFPFPMLSWGIGLATHAFSVFGKNGRWGKDWEQKKIKELMAKEKAKEQELLERF